MSLVRPVCTCAATAVLISGCGIAAKPLAGTPKLNSAPGTHARVDDPRTRHEACLKAARIPFHLFEASGHRPAIQVGRSPSGPTIIFEPTPGDAQGMQIVGQAQAAEVIGSALLYPNQASNSELGTVETCTAVGVTG
jgi:hypothetical protein